MRTFLPEILALGILFFTIKSSAQTCNGSLGDPVAGTDFGYGPTQGGPLPPGVTEYMFKSNDCPTDGEYTIRSSTTNCFNNTWFNVYEDHTPGDNNGYMMIVNASYQPGIFYRQEVRGLCPNTTYEFAAWLMSIPSVNLDMDPNITFLILGPDGSVLGEMNTNYITETSTPQWKQYALEFSTQPGVSEVMLVMRNNGAGGSGNDLAIDDITFRPCGPDLKPQILDANASETHLCEGATRNLQLTTAPVTSIYTSPRYQWQRKINNGSWSDIAGADQAGYTASFVNASQGVYAYRLWVAEAENFDNPNCRVASSPITITVDPAPVITSALEVCEGETLQFELEAVGTFSWSNPDGDVFSTQKEPLISNIQLNQAGEYTVVINNGLCNEIRTTTVTVIPKPIADAGMDVEICYGGSTTLSASGGVTYQWQPATGLSDPHIANPVAAPSATTTYTVTVTGADNCIATDEVTVHVFQPLVVDAGPDQVTIAGKAVQLNASVNKEPATYDLYWEPATGLSDPNALSPIASPTEDRLYTLRVVPKNGCAPAESTVFIRVYQKLSLPNAFTPNGDGINDTWNIIPLSRYAGSVLTVYNRYGQLVFQTKGGEKSWDGTFKGKELPAGVYYYLLDFGEPGMNARSGSISILR